MKFKNLQLGQVFSTELGTYIKRTDKTASVLESKNFPRQAAINVGEFVKVKTKESAEYSIEFDYNCIPRGWKPVEFRRPNIGDNFLIFNSQGYGQVIRYNGNVYFGPVLILKKL